MIYHTVKDSFVKEILFHGILFQGNEDQQAGNIFIDGYWSIC